MLTLRRPLWLGGEREHVAMSPYRQPASKNAPREERSDGSNDGGLVGALVLFWVVSIIRVVGGVVRHETFGAEATLAVLAVVIVPVPLGGALERWWQRWWLGRRRP